MYGNVGQCHFTIQYFPVECQMRIIFAIGIFSEKMTISHTVQTISSHQYFKINVFNEQHKLINVLLSRNKCGDIDLLR